MKIKGRLGSGSFGTVYKISVEDQPYALKKIKLQMNYEESDSYLKEVQNQAEMLAICTYHPNIVRYYHSFQQKDNFYIIMEYVGDCNLSDLPTPWSNQKQIANMIIQVSIGLLHLKKHSIIHRDLKSANIIISKRGLLKIADFGISKKIQEKRYAVTCLGTPFYTAPQIVEQKKYDFAVDVWSLGIIIYQVTHGVLPFKADNMQELRRMIREDNPKIDPNFHKDLQFILGGCLQKDPKKRITVEQILSTPLLRKQMKEELDITHRYFG